MGKINPNIIQKVQDKVELRAKEWAADKSLENFLDGIKAQINETEILEVFPDAKDDYQNCIRYMNEIGDDPQVEEIADDIQSKVKTGQDAWDEIFGLRIRTESSVPGQESTIFNRDLRYTRSGDDSPERSMNMLHDSLSNVLPGVYNNNRTLINDSGDELDASTVKDLLDEKLGVVLTALNTLQVYRQELSRINDPDYQKEQAESEDMERYSEELRERGYH